MASYKVSGLVAQGTASADDLLYLVDTEDGGSTYASKSITVGNFLNGYATESFVSTQLDALVNGAPAALDTLKELSDALGADSNFSTTITNLINANEVHVDNMATLTGVAKDDTDLGTFTGSTIGDSLDIKAALQALETSLETKGSATLLNATTSDKNDLVTLSGVSAGSGNLGSFTGSIISDDVTIKSALQELETEVARVDGDISTQIAAIDLSGITTNATNINALQTDLTNEISARQTADNAETTARTNADSALSGRLDTLEADPTTQALLDAETTARGSADNALSGRLDTLEADPTTATALSSEASTRAAADTALSGRLDVLEADPTTQTLLNAETAGRVANDSALANRLNVLEADPTTATALASEAGTRASADTALSNRLDTLEADPTTQTLLDAETTARQAADALKLDLTGGTLTGDIGVGNSTVIRANGTAHFGGNITSEAVPTHNTHLVNKLYADNLVAGVDLSGIATNAAAIAALTNGAPELLNTLSELADAINDDENFATTITGQISSEATTRANADTALSGRLDTLEADPTTATAVSNEASARASADTALSNRLDTLEADPTTQTLLDAETTSRVSGDNALSGRLDVLEADPTTATALSSEASTRAAADSALSGRLDTLEADPTTQSALDSVSLTLSNSIAAEETARIAADALLMPKAGGVFTGAVTGIAPTADLHFATKKYADDLVANIDLTQIEQNRLDIIAEATARANAITALTNGAVAQNTAAIAAEVNTDRDAAITAAITALTNGAVAQNAADILQEISDRQTAVAAEAAARNTAIASLNASLTTTNNNVTTNATAISTEEAARVAADAGKVDKASSVNVHMVGETSAASAPVDAQGADNYLFLVVDKATGAIKSIEKSFLEAE